MKETKYYCDTCKAEVANEEVAEVSAGRLEERINSLEICCEACADQILQEIEEIQAEQ